MNLALLGGTGDIGRGLALRWAKETEYEIVIGSRSASRARSAAQHYQETLAEHGVNSTLSGAENRQASAQADIIILGVPPAHIQDTIETITPALTSESIVVSPAVDITRDESGFQYVSPESGSVAAEAVAMLPESTALVGAYHSLPAKHLARLETPLHMDTPVFGTDKSAIDKVIEVTNSIDGLRGIPVGGLATAGLVERLAPLLMNVVRSNPEINEAGVKFTWPGNRDC